MATFFLLSVLSGRQNIVLAKDHLEKPKVAIVGAGIGGSTASYFLRELMGDDLEIIVFDRSFKTGGRTEVRIVSSGGMKNFVQRKIRTRL